MIPQQQYQGQAQHLQRQTLQAQFTSRFRQNLSRLENMSGAELREYLATYDENLLAGVGNGIQVIAISKKLNREQQALFEVSQTKSYSLAFYQSKGVLFTNLFAIYARQYYDQFDITDKTLGDILPQLFDIFETWNINVGDKIQFKPYMCLNQVDMLIYTKFSFDISKIKKGKQIIYKPQNIKVKASFTPLQIKFIDIIEITNLSKPEPQIQVQAQTIATTTINITFPRYGVDALHAPAYVISRAIVDNLNLTQVLPKLKFNITSQVYESYCSKVEKNLQGKAINEFRNFNQQWMVCGDCLRNYYSQLNFYKTTKGKDVGPPPLETNGGIFKESGVACGGCTQIIRNYLMTVVNPGIKACAANALKMTDNQLFDSWQKWYLDKYPDKKNQYRLVLDSYKNKNNKVADIAHDHENLPDFLETEQDVQTFLNHYFYRYDFKNRMINILRKGWETVCGRLLYEPLPRSQRPQQSDDEFDPEIFNGTNPYPLEQTPKSGGITFRYDPTYTWPKLGGNVLQWGISYARPRNQILTTPIDNSSIVYIGVSITGKWGIINHQEIKVTGLNTKKRPREQLLRAGPFNFLSGINWMSDSKFISGYWQDCFAPFFSGIVKVLSDNGLIARVQGGKPITANGATPNQVTADMFY